VPPQAATHRAVKAMINFFIAMIKRYDLCINMMCPPCRREVNISYEKTGGALNPYISPVGEWYI
jgi:hypothetical protein